MITQISYEYRLGMLKGTEEFNSELKKAYNTHARPKWMPAAGGNFEMWFDVFVDSKLADFLKDAIVGKATYELTKHFILRPFIDSLNKLEIANEYPLEIQTYVFYFEDTTVKIYCLHTNFNSIFSAIFSELFQQYEQMKKTLSANNIHEIRISVDPETGKNDWWEGPGEIGPYLTYWGVSLEHGVDFAIWDVKKREVYKQE